MPDEQPVDQTADAAASSQVDHLGETMPGMPRNESADCVDAPPELRQHPRYRIERLLGRGGMGSVFQATHLVMHRPVALKVMRHDLTGNADAVERFRREVRAAAQLSHPNIVAAFDAEQVGDSHFLVMEFVEGRSLAQLVAHDGPLPVATAVDLAIQAANGLQHAFERGMIHRDIKPHNLMIAELGSRNAESDSPPVRAPGSGLLKILDFGLARFASDGGSTSAQTASGMILGTVDFMAPEQADNARSADVRSDIYSLGCTLFYLLAGRVPFPEGTVIQRVMAHVRREPPPLDRLRPGLPTGLVAVVAKMLAKEPDERYQTPAEVARALAAFASAPDVAAPATSAALAPTIAKFVDIEEVLEAIPVASPQSPKPASSLKPRPRPIEIECAPPAPARSGRALLGCFLLAALAIVGVIGVSAYGIWLVVNRVSSGVSRVLDDAMKQSQHWDALEARFDPPPADAPDDRLFPKVLDGHERKGVDTKAEIPQFDLDAKGRHAVYGAGDQAIHVNVYQPVTRLEKEALFRRALDAVDKEQKSGGGGFHSTSGTAQNSRLAIHLDRVGGLGKSLKIRAQFWWSRNTLIIVHTQPNTDPQPRLTEYLEWLDAQPRKK